MTIAIVWIISVTIGLPIVLGLNTSPERTPELCIFYNSDFIIYSSLGSFYIPCVLMVFLYYRIFKAIHERAKRQIGSSSVIVNSHASKSGNNINNKIINVTAAAATPTTNTSSSNNTDGKKSSHSSLSTARAQITGTEVNVTTTGAIFSDDICDVTCNNAQSKESEKLEVVNLLPVNVDDDKSTHSATAVNMTNVSPLSISTSASRSVNNNANRKPTGITHVEIVSDEMLPNDAIVIENVITKSVVNDVTSSHETESTEMTVMSFPQLPVKSGRFGSRSKKFLTGESMKSTTEIVTQTTSREECVQLYDEQRNRHQLNRKNDSSVHGTHKTNDSESNLYIEKTNKNNRSSYDDEKEKNEQTSLDECCMTGDSDSQIIENKGARDSSRTSQGRDSESSECVCKDNDEQEDERRKKDKKKMKKKKKQHQQQQRHEDESVTSSGCKTSCRASSDSSSSSSISASASASSCQCSSNNSVIERSQGVSSSSSSSCASGSCSSPSGDVSTSSASQSIMPTILSRKDSHSLVLSPSSRVQVRNDAINCSHESHEKKQPATTSTVPTITAAAAASSSSSSSCHSQPIHPTTGKQVSLRETDYAHGHSSVSHLSQELTKYQATRPVEAAVIIVPSSDLTKKPFHLNEPNYHQPVTCENKSNGESTFHSSSKRNDVGRVDSSTSQTSDCIVDSSVRVLPRDSNKSCEINSNNALILGNPMTEQLSREEETSEMKEQNSKNINSGNSHVTPACCSRDGERGNVRDSVLLIISSASNSGGTKCDQQSSSIDENKEVTTVGEAINHHVRQNSISSKVTGTISKYMRKTSHFKSSKFEAKCPPTNQSSLVKLSPLGKLYLSQLG